MNQELPIFPLGLVLLPQMKVPLHIFEERYREMVEFCLENDKPFGIIYYNGSNFRTTGCTARITDVLQTYDDGRKDIMTRGEKRFSINEIDSSGLFLKADVNFFEDCSTTEADNEAQRLKKEAVTLFSRLASLNNKEIDLEFLGQMDPEDFSFLLSASDLLSIEERQESLESSSTPNRIQNLITSARRSIQRSEANNKLVQILGENIDIRHIFN